MTVDRNHVEPSPPPLFVIALLESALREGVALDDLGEAIGVSGSAVTKMVERSRDVLLRVSRRSQERMDAPHFERSFDSACPGLADQVDVRLQSLGLERIGVGRWSHKQRGRRTGVALSTGKMWKLSRITLDWHSSDKTGDLTYQSAQFATSGAFICLAPTATGAEWCEDSVLVDGEAVTAFLDSVEGLISFCAPVVQGESVAQTRRPLTDVSARVTALIESVRTTPRT